MPEKNLALKKESISVLGQLVLLMTIAALAPVFKLQPITGTIVNAILFIAVGVLGFKNAFFVGFLPSLISLSIGFLPMVLAPMVPYIILGNLILMAVFASLKNKNFWLAIFSSGILKFVFLFSISQILINWLSAGKIASGIAMMMSWPQLFTAFSGGVIAYFVLKVLRKTN